MHWKEIKREKWLQEEMSRLGVRESDILEHFVRSSGPGGQNVNKTSTCVYLKHLPTGTEVKCQGQRSQSANRYAARGILLRKIEAARQEKLAAERQAAEKLRRAKRKRPQWMKTRILEEKRRHSQKKRFRAAMRHAGED